MDLTSLFKGVSTLTADEAKRTMEESAPGDVTLLDVREPREYEEGHLPGAVHIPLSQLADRLGELDRGRPVVTY